jgi:hypothetical protein
VNSFRLSFILIFSFFLLNLAKSSAQIIEEINVGSDIDSSYYDVYQLAEGDIWLGGEFGVLKRMRTDGTIQSIVYPNKGSNILKFFRIDDFLYIAADHGTIYKFNLLTEQISKTEFPNFKNRCFYDLTYNNAGKLIVCGGSSGIGRGKKRIPMGFVASIDTSLTQEPEVIWKNSRKFVWALSQEREKGFSAAIFNGTHSTIYHFTEANKDSTSKGVKVKGLIHALNNIDGRLVYSGCRSIQYHKRGIWGFEDDRSSYRTIDKAGIICNVIKLNSKLYGFTQQGSLLELSNNSNLIIYQTPNASAFYEALAMNKQTLLLAGHGKSLIKILLN